MLRLLLNPAKAARYQVKLLQPWAKTSWLSSLGKTGAGPGNHAALLFLSVNKARLPVVGGDR